MEKICLALLYSFINIVLGQQCPSPWYGYSATSKCYRFMYQNRMTWQDSRNLCQIHGGDLLKIDSVAERTWIYRQITNLKTHAHIPTDNWWTGLNDREYLNTWEWADGSPVAKNILNWKPGEPNNAGGDERCGEIFNGRINDEGCTDLNKFICSRDRGIPLNCDTDHGWQTANGYCYKINMAKGNWYNAKRRCEHDGGELVTIESDAEETLIHDWAVSLKQQLWIGLYTLQQPGNKVQWLWTNQSQPSTTYWHGTPHVDSHHLNNSCAVVSNTVTNIQAWSVQTCAQSKAFVCKKQEGVCFPGWIGHSSLCYQFDTQYRLSFTGATSYCQRQGAELLRYTSQTTMQFINSYLQEMKDSGDQDFWIGASDNNKDGGPYKWRNGQTVSYKWWAAAHNTPANTRGRQDCAYVSTSDRNGKWRTTTNCGAQKPFVCIAPMGKSIRPIPHTPRPRFGCPANWRLYSGTCYRIYDQAVDWPTARTRCQQTKGADLASIRSSGAQNFINRMCRSGMQYYIGLNDRRTDGIYVWNDETTPTTFTAWQPHQPSNSGHQENCVVQINNRWNDVTCSSKKHYICSLDANTILPPLSTTPAMDWTLKCGPGWESNPVTESCYMFVDQPLSWLDALNQCQAYKSTLVTVHSLTEQNYLAGRIQSMNSIGLWIGANDRGTEGGWRWTSGKPFAFLNWAAGNPSAHGQGTDCVVMYTQNARWDDIDCNQRNGYICEKTGNVPTTTVPRPTTPKVPAGMKLGCRPGWKPYGNNCFYFARTRINWLNAQTTCGRLGGRLASISGRPEQNFLTANLWKNPRDRYDGAWIGLSDRSSESLFTWDDQSVVTYTNWGVNEPNSWMNHNEDCVEAKLNNGMWNDELCTTMKSGFVCKAPKGIVSATQNPYQTGCPLGALGYNSKCYRIVSGAARSWNDAQTWCRNNAHGTLATVNDRYLQSFLSSQLLYRTGYFWLGLSDKAKPGTYAWASGDSVSFTYWYNTHTGNERSTCIGMRADQPIGLWENLGCNTKRNFICQFARHGGYSPQPTIPTPAPNLPCPQGWTGNQQQCYYVFSDPKQRLNWMDAVTYCQSLGGDLPSFHSNHNDSFLQTLIPTSLGFRTFWIGLNDRDTERGYKWSDGSAVDYTNWKANEPNNYKGSEDCAVYITSTHNWNDMNCYATTSYICAIPRARKEILTPNAYRYQDVGIDVSGMTSILFEVQACHDAHVLLMKTPADEAHDIIEIVIGGWSNTQSVMRTVKQQNPPVATVKNKPLDCHNSKPFWVSWAGGIFQIGTGLTVGTGTFLTYNSHSSPTVRAVAVSTGWGVTGTWTFGTKFPTTTVMPTPARSSKCGSDPNWYFYNNNCYYFNPTSGDNGSMTWYDASDFCNSIQATLLSVHDFDENNYIHGIQNTRSTSEVWIGFNKLGLSGYSWTDGSPVDFTNWAANEPNDAFGGERCVEMVRNGQWNDNNCGLKLGYVCKKPVSGHVMITSPAPYPPGGCANGFTRVPGGRNKCFYLNFNHLNWTTARDECRLFGKNYDIASIEDLYEQDFFLSLATKKYSNFWIGLSDRQINNKWLWSDNSPVVFTHWDRGEPTSSNSQAKNKETQNCVAIRMYKGHVGKWADVDCDQTFMSVCQAKQDPNLRIIAPPNNCKKGYKPYQRGCYKLSTDVKTWNDAKTACQADHGALTSINDVYESGFVVTVGSTGLPFWIGLSDSVTPGLYGWVDGWPVRYTNWGYKEPSYDTPGGCVLVNRNGKWNDTDCSRKLHYVCKITPVKPPATTPPPPGQCANSKWIPNGDYCYTVSVNQGRSWPEANYQCQKLGMELASIHSQAEMSFVLNLVTQAKVTDPHYKPNVFIGLSKNPQGSFAWSDGSGINYLNWNSGQPTGLGTHGQLEECIEFDRTSGKWNDVDCFTNRGYVCKALKVFKTTPLPSTVNPVSGLPTNPVQSFPPVRWPNGSIAIPGSSSAQQQQQQRQSNGSSQGLSGGAIAGVAIGCVAVVLLVALLLVLLKSRGIVKMPQKERTSSTEGFGFDNALYHKGNDNVKIDSDA